ncbi:MAG: PPC domain-containing protein [Planctomycetota bacterium]
MAPHYEECRLDTIFPNGGQRGTSVRVEFKGLEQGLSSPKDIVIDGPGGITVKELKSIDGRTLEATLDIAADAPLGRRWLRVLNERSGLTNFAYFVVGSLPERIEVEPNNDTVKPEVVTIPLVMNGRINPAADLDVFKFAGKAGQKLVAAIAAHAIDVHGQYKNFGIADFSLELLDANGRTLAAAEDTIGYDPLIEHTLPADGDYFVRVQLLNYGGFPEAAYRLTLGEVPYITGAFPAGHQRGTDPQIELLGANVAGVLCRMGTLARPLPAASPDGTGKSAHPTIEANDPAYPLHHVTLQDGSHSGLDVPLVVGDLPEIIEAEPNDERTAAAELKWPITVNARFHQPNDADWYRVKLEANQKVWFETIAHRFIRSPIDTLIQVYDVTGKLLGENDDEAFDPNYESYHDFKTADSKLMFTAPAAGEFFVKVTEQTGASGPRTIYRLSVEEARPDFRLSHFPDGVPVWGPGSTACVLVRIDRFAGCDDDIEVSVEGLPAGWTSSPATSLGGKGVRPYNTYQLKVFVTITAPADAVPGTCFPFRIVGRCRGAGCQPAHVSNTATSPANAAVEGQAGSPPHALERPSFPLSLFYTSDTGFFRVSPQSRVAVAKSQGPWLEAIAPEITITAGGNATIRVKVLGAGDGKEMPIVVNIATAGVACVLTTPQNLMIKPSEDGKTGVVEVPIKLAPEIYPGTYGITIAQTWRSDIRIGMPGPCTPLIKLTVVPAK